MDTHALYVLVLRVNKSVPPPKKDEEEEEEYDDDGDNEGSRIKFREDEGIRVKDVAIVVGYE